MSIVRVVVPFKQGKRRFHLLKGRPWSVVEHLMLMALATKSAMRDPALCAEILDQIAELSCSGGHWTTLTSHLARLAQQIRFRSVAQPGHAEASLILGYQHAALVLPNSS